MLSLTHLHTLLHTLPIPVWITDPAGTFLACNPPFERLMGIEATALLGQTESALATEEQIAFVRRQPCDPAAEQPGATRAWLTGTGCGERRLFEITTTPVYDPEGTFAGRLGIAVDVTAQHQAEPAHQVCDDQYHTLFQTMSLGVVYHRADGQIIDANPAAERILGLSREQLQGRTSCDPDWHTVHEDGSPFHGEDHPATVALRTGQPVYAVTMGVFNLRTGIYTWISINAIPQIRPGEQQPFQVYTTFEDITRRRQAEQDAHEGREQYRNLVNGLEALVAERTADLETANRRLAQSAERLALATSSAGIGVWERDIVNNQLVWDAQMCALYGIRPEQFTGTTDMWSKRIHPDDLPRMTAETLQTLRDERDYVTEFRVVWPDGSVRYIAAHAKLDRDTDGNPLRVVGVNWDITAYKLAEQEIDRHRRHLEQLVARLEAANRRLRMSDLRLQALFDLSQQASTIAESDLLRLGINAAVQLTGSLVGYLLIINEDQKTIDSVAWSDRIQNLCATSFIRHHPIPGAGDWADAVRSGGPVVHNDYLQGVTHKGYPESHVSIVRHLGVPVNEAGKARLLLGVGNKPTDYDDADIRELQLIGDDLWRVVTRQRAEEALRASEARYRTLFESSADALIIIDTAQFQIVDGNRAAVTLFALECRDQLIGLNPDQLSPALQPNGQLSTLLLRDHIQHGLAEGSTMFQWAYCTPQGTLFTALVSLSALPVEDQPQVLAIVRDISALKRYEAELEQARDLAEAANRAKSSFLANMSHELRTPLNTILGRSELMREQIYGPLSEPQQKALSSIEESSTHLLALINDVLDLSKIEADQLQLALDVVDVEEICQAALRMVSQSALAKQIQLGWSIDKQTTLMRADGRRLKQILVNLLANAVKFTPDGGRVGLEVKGNCELQTATFIVWDTGIGIAQEDMERLFRPFVQIDSRLSRQYGGTGLGLALVLRLTELHGGSVAVESQPGLGSRFSVILPWHPPIIPRRQPEPPAVPATIVPRYDASHPLILIVEDNTASVQILRDALPLSGYQLAVVGNGAEAVEQAQKLHPALILMDIQLPVMDGLEATRRIRAIPSLCNTPIIALTALAMPGDRERCIEAGATIYLTKPVRLRDLLDQIAAQLQGRSL